jgi:hypothetical protein
MAQYDGQIIINTVINTSEVTASAGKIRNQIDGLSSSFNALGRTIVGVFAISALIKFGDEASKAAITLEASMMRVNDIFGASAQSINTFAENVAFGLGMSRKEAYQYAATYGNLFAGITNSAEENSKRTIQMLQASAVIASKTGRTMQDVMERIRSGLLGNTEAIEDVGINVNVAMLESTEAFQKMADGRTWDKLTFQEQQQVRMLAILEQAHRKFGDEVMKSSAFSMQRFNAAMDNLKTSIGSVLNVALIPVIDALTQFAVLLNRVFVSIFGEGKASQQALTKTGFQAAQGQTKLASDTKKAAKAAKESVAAFDELNVLQRSMSKGAEGAPTGGGMPTSDLKMPSITVDDNASPQVAAIKGSIEALKTAVALVAKYFIDTFKPSVTTAFEFIAPQLLMLVNDVKRYVDQFKVLAKPLENWFINDLIPLWQIGTIQAGVIIGGMVESIRLTLDMFNSELFPIVESFVINILPVLTDLGLAAVAIFTKMFDYIKTIYDTLVNGVMKPSYELMGRIIAEALKIIADAWNAHGAEIVMLITTVIENMKQMFLQFYELFLKPIVDNALKAVSFLWDKHLKDLIKVFIDMVAAITKDFMRLYNQVFTPWLLFLNDKLLPTFTTVFNGIVNVAATTIATLADILKGLFKILQGVIDFVTGVFTLNWKLAWQGVSKVFEGVFDVITGVFKGAINIMVDAINFIIREINKLKIDVPDWIPEIGGSSIGFSIPQIPKLAKGAVISPNAPFLAMLGDQPSGINIETPLETMLEAFKGALTEMGTSGGGEATMVMDGSVIGRLIIPHIDDEKRRLGVNLLGV